MDVYSTASMLWRIVLPMAKPLIAVMTLLAFMTQWNDFLLPLITLRDPDLYTLPMALRFLQGPPAILRRRIRPIGHSMNRST